MAKSALLNYFLLRKWFTFTLPLEVMVNPIVIFKLLVTAASTNYLIFLMKSSFHLCQLYQFPQVLRLHLGCGNNWLDMLYS